MLRQIEIEEEEVGAGRPDAADAAPQRTPRTVTVNLVMGTSGMRSVNLPLEAVDGRTVREVINAAAMALRGGDDIAAQTFGENLLHMFADSDTAVHHIMGPDQDRPLSRSQRVSVTLGESLTFGLYVDHVGGDRPR